MNKKKELEEYSAKRDFRSTPEPSNEGEITEEDSIFVVQKHDASNLHYDFRLEVERVLKSWAVPKGPPTDPKDRRLAIRTEDHPLGYAGFEGVIPEGEYGAGVVMVWDRGVFENLEEKSLLQSLEDGHVKVRLEGEKLRGGYALIRTGDEEDDKWLLIKIKGDDVVEGYDPLVDEPDSVLTGRSLEQIAGGD